MQELGYHPYTDKEDIVVHQLVFDIDNYLIHQFQNLIQEIHRGGSILDGTYQASSLIDKLPLSWAQFVRELRRNQSSLTLRLVIQSIRIEDQFRIREVQENQLKAKVNLTEAQNQETKFKGKKFKGQFKPRG